MCPASAFRSVSDSTSQTRTVVVLEPIVQRQPEPHAHLEPVARVANSGAQAYPIAQERLVDDVDEHAILLVQRRRL
jgi:hypothetical protein